MLGWYMMDAGAKPEVDKKGGNKLPFEYKSEPPPEPPKPTISECSHGAKLYTLPDGTKMATCGNKH